MKMTGVASCIS